MGGGSGSVTSPKALGSMPSRKRLALPTQLALTKVLRSIESAPVKRKGTAQATPWPMRFQEFRGPVITTLLVFFMASLCELCGWGLVPFLKVR